MQQLLIDGHNLIAQVPGLSLADPDDEQKLVALLRTYAQRKRAKIVVVFDSGLPGGESRELSGGGVTAIFAGSHTIADRILIERIRELKKPSEWSVVSSDREVQQAADRREMLVRSSQDFASMLIALLKRPVSDRPVTDDQLSNDEVNEWLRIFDKKPRN
jgi:predicted RNA-binding protein with PIN domain